MAQYAHPDVLVETAWLANHLQDAGLRVVEIDEDPNLYGKGHIPGAIEFNWERDLNDPIRRDFIDQSGLTKLFGAHGIAKDTTVVLYGDKNNWFATYAFWLLYLLGHDRLKVLNGGRAAWEAEGRALVTEVSTYAPTVYEPGHARPEIRAFLPDVKAGLGRADRALVDVRSLGEFTGELLAMPSYPQEGARRGGHIPGAVHIPWSQNVGPDGRFKSADELRSLYQQSGVVPEKDVTTYCRIGERSSHSWFTLTFLLGYPKVRNYDGSWTEWGNAVAVPIETGAPQQRLA